MRHLIPAGLAGLWLLSRALTHGGRSLAVRLRCRVTPQSTTQDIRAERVRLVLPSSTTGWPAPPLPERPVLPWEKAATFAPERSAVADITARSRRAATSRRGLIVLIAIGRAAQAGGAT